MVMASVKNIKAKEKKQTMKKKMSKIDKPLCFHGYNYSKQCILQFQKYKLSHHLIFSEFSSTFIHINISLLTHKVGIPSTHTLQTTFIVSLTVDKDRNATKTQQCQRHQNSSVFYILAPNSLDRQKILFGIYQYCAQKSPTKLIFWVQVSNKN